jgi:putative MATE family efflux protein
VERGSDMREDSFTKKIFYRFFFPAVGASICLGLANLADALCVGMVMGEAALAAISLVTPIYMVFNVLHLGMAVGGSVIFAQLMGGGKVKQAVNVFRQMLLMALVVSAALAVLGEIFVDPLIVLLGADPAQGMVYEMTRSYAVRLLAAAPLFFLNMIFYYFLRCDDGERRASVGLAVSNLLDVGLSFVFVLGFKMGINGAVYSTIVGVGAAVLIYLPHFFKKANILSLRLARPDFKVMAQCYRTGFSSSSQYIWQFLFFLVINNLLISRHGESGLAVFNVVLNISYLVVGLFDGVAATIQPLAATFHGERNRQAERDTLRLGLKWGGALGALLLGMVALGAPQVGRLFGLSEEMAGMGALALRMYCVGGIGVGTSMLLSSYWQAVGKEHQTMVLTFLRSFAVYLAFAVPLAMGPLAYFWLVYPATEGVSLAIVAVWRMVVNRRNRLQIVNLDEAPIFHRMLQQDLQELSGLLEECEEFCALQGASMQQTFFVTMAVEEMSQAIFAHAQESGRSGIYIQITLFQSEPGVFDLHIRDNAMAFDPFSLRTNKISEADSEELAMDSMGVLMVKKKAKEFYYRHFQGFNTLLVRI